MRNLLQRLQKLESQAQGDKVTIHFDDGSTLPLQRQELMGLWQNVNRLHESSIYQTMKGKHKEGINDTNGLIHLMMAYDPEENRGLWNDEEL